MVKIDEIEPNRSQPRQNFDEDALQELADSIKLHGIIQPLIVQKNDEFYKIIAGERRWRAARLAGLTEVPVIIKDYTPMESMEIALIENLQADQRILADTTTAQPLLHGALEIEFKFN